MFAEDDKPTNPQEMPAAKPIEPDSRDLDVDTDRRHRILVDCLRDEAELQAEERVQMAIDGDYQDHLHWRLEDAEILMDRGQAPLVFNEGRLSVEWMCGMQKRMRTDYNILPRAKDDEQIAPIKEKVFKYTDDVNLAPWHISFAFRQAVISGLGWLEEGIETAPDREQIFGGSEDWRNVFRDSRSRHFDINEDSRYLFRKKRVDLDYAQALLPKAKAYLKSQAMRPDEHDRTSEDIWYLGERLTGATEIGNTAYVHLSDRYRDRSAYIGGFDRLDAGRRLSVDLIESWYRVPEAVKVFGAGPLKGREVNRKDPAHAQLVSDRWRMYDAVVMRMRVMIMTENAPLWDGRSPFKHGKFSLIPVWGSRRGRDGQPYGLWRGMRDINDDLNKRASKALHAASSNRVVSKKNNVDDVEEAREEAARPDMFLEVKNIEDIKFEKPALDMEMNMQLLNFDRDALRNAGGVTNDNLGRDSNVISGKAVGLKQDQGSLVTSEFPDNLRLALLLRGKIRLANIEQFMTEKQVIRITGEGTGNEWLTINEPQEDGSVLNPISASEADFIISFQNYRESFAQAAMESMMELLQKVAAFNPQLVTAVLDLVVESSEIHGKEEWVARIRKLNGQRDPKKPPTPEELQQQAQEDARAEEMKALELENMRLTVQELRAKIDNLFADMKKTDTEAILRRVESMFSALQAAQIVATTPTVAPVADTIMAGAGFEDQAGQDPNIPAPETAALPPQAVADAPLGTVAPAGGLESPLAAMPSPGAATSPGEGEMSGIQTPTGADNAP